MDDRTDPHGSSPRPHDHDRLDSWKQIAVYLGRGVTTVQRWEQEKALPVHRLPHAKKGSVFAFKRELDAWLLASEQPAGPLDEAESPPVVRRQGPPWRRAAIATALLSLVMAGMTLRLAPADSGSDEGITSVRPRPLANTDAPEGSPSLSPDGAHVIYSKSGASAGLYVTSVAGGEARLLPLPADVAARRPYRPVWSPAGDLIAFITVEGEMSRALYLAGRNGGAARYLTSLAGVGLCWAPDGRRIAFADRTSAAEPFAIFAMAVSGGPRQRLTAPPASSFGDAHCAFSPDGRSLAVARYATRHESHLHVVDLDSADPANSDQRSDSLNGIAGVAWSPDGSSIVAGTAHGLWSIAARGPRTKPSLIAGFEAGAIGPAFAATGPGRPPRLVYQHQIRDVNIWKWSRGAGVASAPQKLTDANWYDDFPALSPNGRRIAFASNRTSVNELWVADADGANPRQVTFHRGALVLAPQWSPDGEHIAFSSNAAGNRDIYTVSGDGSKSERVTSELADEDNPTWSRDGQWIYFTSKRSGEARLWRVRRAGGAIQPVTRGPASQGVEAPDGRSVYFVRSSDVPGLWSVPIGGGDERLIIPDVREGFWAVAPSGIVFIPAREGNADRTFEIRLFDLASEAISTLVRLRAPHFPLMPGLAVSQDLQHVLWTQIDRSEDDVMIIDAWMP